MSWFRREQRCTVLIDDVWNGVSQATWIVGKDVDRQTYEQFKDENGNLFMMVHYEDGKAVSHIVAKAMYLQLKSQLDAIAPHPPTPLGSYFKR